MRAFGLARQATNKYKRNLGAARTSNQLFGISFGFLGKAANAARPAIAGFGLTAKIAIKGIFTAIPVIGQILIVIDLLIIGIKKLGQGWTVKIGENKIIIFTLAKSNFTDHLFDYVGELRINSCRFVNWDKKQFYAKVQDLNQNTWNQNYGTFDFDARKPEEIETQTIIGRKVKKSSI